MNENMPIVTGEDVRQLCSTFKEFVIRRNMPECKKFIQDFVKEVIFNMAFLLPKNSETIDVIIKLKRIKLFQIYSNSFYIKEERIMD